MSYRALFAVPGFARVAGATLLARLSGQMWEIVLVLFVLQRYRSPALAGLTVLLSVVPGLFFGPIAGALLDRQGRLRLMIVDYVTSAMLSAAIALLSLAHALPVPLLLGIVTVLSLTNILSISGARSLFPLMVPRPLWDRSNGFDTSTYSLTAIVGPAIAGVLVARFDPERALLVIGAIVGIAALALIGVREPIETRPDSSPLLRTAWKGLVFVVRHASLRGLAISLFVSNLGFGVLPIAIPVIVLRNLHGSPATVGAVFAVFGVAGFATALLVGRRNTEGRERNLIATAMAFYVPVLLAFALAGNVTEVFLIAVLAGAAGSLINVGIFGLRQRRTDPAWFGRAFAVSLSLNYAGQPIGSAIAGPVIERSPTIALLYGAAFNVIGAALVITLIPREPEGQVG